MCRNSSHCQDWSTWILKSIQALWLMECVKPSIQEQIHGAYSRGVAWNAQHPRSVWFLNPGLGEILTLLSHHNDRRLILLMICWWWGSDNFLWSNFILGMALLVQCREINVNSLYGALPSWLLKMPALFILYVLSGPFFPALDQKKYALPGFDGSTSIIC